MSDLRAKIEHIEACAKRRRVAMRQICQRADIAVSTVRRWKKGITSPTLSKWESITDAAIALIGRDVVSAPYSPSADNTAAHIARSSTHPTHDTDVGRVGARKQNAEVAR